MKTSSAIIVPVIIAGVLMLNGCAMFRMKVKEDDVANLSALDAKYGAQDLRKLTQEIADDIANSPFLKDQKTTPIVIIYGVQPRTETFVDTKAFTERLRTILTQSGKVLFVNDSRRDELLKEQGFQAANATPETRTAVGKQLGAKYMLTGALVEMTKESGRQVRVSKTELNYYQLTIDITDLETGIIVWSAPKEFAREASKPLIGW